ncbi:MAG TPA: phenylacetic acid degradation bifunctional protein PaaZ [Flavobacteriales bacterium]|nr:phenylacetic acid degradation bifunctional protein PaaZ [Flavobacteriales bacterium]
MKLKNYTLGKWVEGSGDGTPLFNAVNGEQIATATSNGLDFKAMLEYARTVGGPPLRKMTFHDRGRMLKALALHLNEKKDIFYGLSAATGATKMDSWIDIEGGIGNLFVYASKGRRDMPDESFYIDGNAEALSKKGTFIGHHICVPMEGTAVHINAFNFPCWGMLEKIAVNFLAGVPAVVKPATITSFLTEIMVKEIIDSKILPEGALQLICGSAGDLLSHVTSQDIVTFTGSATTGRMLKSSENIINNSVRFNMEADSLNCSILGPDAIPGTAEFDLFIKEVVREMTVKAGQKCTAIRRVLVPENLTTETIDALKNRLAGVPLGDPSMEGVKMGPLAGKVQVDEVKERVQDLLGVCELAYGGYDSLEVKSGDKEKGAYMPTTLLYCDDPNSKMEPHSIEAFGPVSTVMPYKDAENAAELSKMGMGSLVSSVFTADDNFAKKMVLNTASMHGRILVLNEECAKESTGHGSPMPHLVHGGPGRAGGGEEMGGIRGVMHYMQRTAIQGSPTTISKITNEYQVGAAQTFDVKHPFMKMFDELSIGETYITHKRTVTEADIVNFANVSGDHFYAHTDVTSLEGTIFEQRVAHGYFIISAAAGLFVDPRKGPVLANYGIDECRFTKPVYVGATIGVRLTVKQKISQEKRDDDPCAKGIVKWLVEVYDETDETVALATVLTLVQRKED